MKPIKTIITCFLVALLAVSCEDYLDPINEVPIANDVSKPQVTINFPEEGEPVVDTVALVTVKLVATDDIELGSVVLQLDGAQVASFNSFKDYRRAVIECQCEVADGDHTLTVVATDKTGKTSDPKSVSFKKITGEGYIPMDGEALYFSFNDNYLDFISGEEAGIVGSPGFAEGKVKSAYAGATDAYLTFPATEVMTDEFSVAFWYKINATPPRGGILAISPPGDSRNSGLRMFHENSGDNQNLGLNFGIGEVEVWMNPFVTIPPTQDWMHIAITISTTHAAIYVDGAVVKEQDIDAKISWANCTSISIGSGMPNFGYWEHYSDLSLYDEMHMFTRALTGSEVYSLYSVK